MSNATNNLNVILVDDDADTQAVIGTIMEYNRHSLKTFGNAQDALRHLHKSPAPDVILLDIYLPDGNGYQTLDAIRQIIPGVKVIAMTAYYTDTTAADIKARGFNGYLPKPLNSSHLINYLQELCN